MNIVPNENKHRCAECSRNEDETRFRLNGSNRLRKYCEECSKLRVRRLNGKPEPEIVEIDETPRPTGYAMMRYGDTAISFESDRSAACLTDLWRSADSPENKDPYLWLRQAQAIELIAQYAGETNLIGDQVIQTRRGSVGGGTWAPKEIALAYAMYLNPALHLACLRFVLGNTDRITQSVSASSDLLIRIVEQNNTVLQALGLLPSIDKGVRGITGALAGAEFIHTKQVVLGQVYIIRLTDQHYIEIAKRLLRNVIRPGEHLIAIGRTSADGNVQDLRLEDYGGKFPFRTEDYEALGVIPTDAPKGVESLLLDRPLLGAIRGTLAKGGKSRTFLIANSQGINEYRSLGSGYRTLADMRSLFGCGDQLDLFGGA